MVTDSLAAESNGVAPAYFVVAEIGVEVLSVILIIKFIVDYLRKNCVFQRVPLASLREAKSMRLKEAVWVLSVVVLSGVATNIAFHSIAGNFGGIAIAGVGAIALCSTAYFIVNFVKNRRKGSVETLARCVEKIVGEAVWIFWIAFYGCLVVSDSIEYLCYRDTVEITFKDYLAKFEWYRLVGILAVMARFGLVFLKYQERKKILFTQT
jgi:hypothetical protein